MSKFATIKFNGTFLCKFPIEKLGLIDKEKIKYYFTDTLIEMIQSSVSTCFNELLTKASRGTKPGGREIQLIEAFKMAINSNEQMYIGDKIGILNFDVMDKLLTIKYGKRKGTGWWRVLESRQDTIINNNYMFIPKKNRGKFNEGLLIPRIPGIRKFKPHTYSIKDKRYITNFLKNLTKETIDNKLFMDNVMFVAVSKMLYDINLYSGVPSNE